MARQFSDTTNNSGLLQLFEKEIGASYGYVSGNTARLQEFTGDANDALNDFKFLEITADGTWQSDDTNFDDYAIIKTNIVSGQADYPFLKDENNNYILEIERIDVADENGTFRRIEVSDVQTEKDTIGFINTVSGVPYRYDLIANAIFLDPVPNYNYTNGLQMYVSRTNSYFVTSDTTKIPGIPALFHRYIAIKAAHTYAERQNLEISERLFRKVFTMEQQIQEYYARRNNDKRKRLTVSNESNR